MNDIKKFAAKSRSMFLTPGYVGGVFKYSGAVWRMPCGYGAQAHAVDARAFGAAVKVAGKNLTIDRDGQLTGTTGSVQIDDAGIGMVPDVGGGAVTGEGIALDLRALVPYASTDDTRRNICGVHVAGDGWAVAVNGHVMRVDPVPMRSGNCIVPVELAAVAPVVTLYPDHCTGGGAVVDYVDDTFPDWRHVMPGGSSVPFTMELPAKLPGKLREAVLCTGDADGCGWRLTRSDGLDVHVAGSGAVGRVFKVAPTYLSMLAGRVCYQTGGPNRPILAIGDDGSRVVVMPHSM